jgi:hypothetical protein
MCYATLIQTEAVDSRPSDRSMRSRRFASEPALSDLLHDPIAHALMAADKVDSREVYALLRTVRSNIDWCHHHAQ